MADSSDKPADTRKKAFVQTEQQKQLHVSHWDQDYLPREDLEEAYSHKPASGNAES